MSLVLLTCVQFLAHRAEKWTRFSLTRPSGSALNDALLGVEHRIGSQKWGHFWVRCSSTTEMFRGVAAGQAWTR